MNPNLVVRIALAVVMVAASAHAEEAPEGAHRTGRYTLKLTERDPRSSIDVLQERYGWDGLRQPREAYEYKSGDESFEVVVPEGYRAGDPHGVLVWIDPGPRGAPPDGWLDALKSSRLIWIGANNSGNDRQPVARRIMLVIDAAHEIQRRYTITPQRVYVGGLSGGGRMASQAAMAFPDVFTGAMPIVGVDYIRRVPVPDTKFQYNVFNRPPPALYRKALTQTRWVLMTGEKDYNRPQTHAVYQAMKADRFAHVTYLEQPGMGHTYPDGPGVTRAVSVLDRPLAEASRAALEEGARSEEAGRLGAALTSYGQAQRNGLFDPIAAEARRKWAALDDLRRESIAVLDARLDAGQTAGVLADIQRLQRTWAPLADDEAQRLVAKLRGR